MERFNLEFSKSKPKHEGERIIYGIEIDFEGYHYAKYSPNEELMNSLHDELKIIKLGIENEK